MYKKLIFALLLVFSLVGAGCSTPFLSVQNQEEQKPVLRIGYREHIAYSPLFVGLEQGYFKDQGLEIEAIKFESTNQMMDALLSGQIDASLGGINTQVLLSVEQESPDQFKIVSLTSESTSTPFINLITGSDSNISSIKELEGKKVGGYEGSFAKVIFKKVMSSHFNPDENDFVQTSPGLQIQMLESGQVDASIVLEPLGSVAIRKGIAKNVETALFAHYFFDKTPFAASVVSMRFLSEYPNIAEKLITATENSIRYINNNGTETKKISIRYSPLEADVLDQMALPIFEDINPNTIIRLQKLSDMFLKDGLLTREINIADMLLYD